VAERVISIHKEQSIRIEHLSLESIPQVKSVSQSVSQSGSRVGGKKRLLKFLRRKGVPEGMPSIDLMGAPPVPRFKRHIKPPFLPPSPDPPPLPFANFEPTSSHK
jgi:hypothetical protein